ncbi:hypothetical protein WJX72_004932 [[Myrmecia] bisecta]|uniref:Uncharacterized protein n=1 Tax=[Myrmecia] bisecta TaxID=41462 RepID=A0AAW1PJ05_9CHLO
MMLDAPKLVVVSITATRHACVAEAASERARYLATLQRNINGLSDADRVVRRQAAESLHRKLLVGGPDMPAASAEQIQEIVGGPLLTPLLRLLSDPAERCREIAVSLFSAAVSRSPDVAQIAALLCCALEDPYHEIKKLASTGVQQVAASGLGPALQPHLPALIAALLANFGHPHSRVRLASMQALDALVLQGVPTQLMSEMIAPSIRTLADDKTAAVREACFRACAGWLAVGGRVKPGGGALYSECAADLLPSLLLGLTDASKPLVQACVGLVQHVGSVASQGEQPEDETSLSAAAQATPYAADGESVMPASQQFTIPFQRRPSCGCRALVAGLLPRLLPPALRDLREWTPGLRLGAARLLRMLVLLGEQTITTHLPQLMPALMSAVGDAEVEVAAQAVRGGHLLGALLPPPHWLALALEPLQAPRAASGHYANGLLLLASLLYAAGCVQHAMTAEATIMVAEALAQPELRACSHPAVQQQMVAVISNLIRLAGAASAGAAQQLWHVLLQLQAGEQVAQQAAAAAEHLATACGLATSQDLAHAYADQILAAMAEGSTEWKASSPDCTALRALLRACAAPTLQHLWLQVVAVLAPCLQSSDRDPALQLQLLRLVDELEEDESKAAALQGQPAVTLLTQLLVPTLVWRAGKSAAAVRFAAITAVATLLRRRLVSGEQLQLLANREGQLLAVILQSMEEEYYADTRLMACHAMLHLVTLLGAEMTDEQRRAIYPELLKRLDDSSNTVRIAVCEALAAFVFTLRSGYDDANTGYLLNGLLIHMDDVDPELQEAVCQVAAAMAQVKPELVAACVCQARPRHRTPAYCDRVLAACQTT